MVAADVRYRHCEHCYPLEVGGEATCPATHTIPCPYPACPGRMPIDPETEG